MHSGVETSGQDKYVIKMTSGDLSLSTKKLAYRHSVKERILMRKLDNHRNSENRWSVKTEQPHGGDKDLFFKSDSIRRKLTKNRQELNSLLNKVPAPIGRTQSRDIDSKDAPKPDRHDDRARSPVVRGASGSEKTRSLAIQSEDSSSSDEELREPMAETLPNLSDEESFPPSCEFRRAQPPSSFNGSKKCVVSIARTSSRANMLSHSRANNLYESAKPRPPPRSHRKKDESSRTQNGGSAPMSTNQEIITLPYVSRGAKGYLRSSDISKLRRSNRSSVTDDVSEKSSSPIRRLAQSESDTSPSRRTMSSSGYSSPGSSIGSSSLSPSSSNASSTSAHSLATPTAATERVEADARARSYTVPGSNPNPTIFEEESLETRTEVASSLTSSVNNDEDVFPVADWTQSSEYRRISQVDKQESLDHDTTSTLVATSDVNNTDSDVASLETALQTASDAVKSSGVTTGASQSAEQTTNIICMVEPASTFIKSKPSVSSSVKIRIPKVGRSKKSSSSRNSLAFAMQASSALGKTPEERSETLPTNFQNSSYEKSRRAKSLSPKAFANPRDCEPESNMSASLANLDKVGVPDGSGPAQRTFNTVSGATGRHMTEQSRFFDDERTLNRNNNNADHYASARSVYNTSSLWSLNPSSDPNGRSPPRKPSLRNRLKGAFSFQNIRRAISIDKLNEDDNLNQRSVSHCYLNEYGQDISQLPSSKPPRKKSLTDPSSTAFAAPPLQKAPSISSIFSTVRMRKRKSRERRARNTIAVVKQNQEYDPKRDISRPKSLHTPSKTEDVGNPAHFRPIGRVLQMDAKQGTFLIEMRKPPSGPYGFYLARTKESGDHGSVFVSSLSDSYPDKMFAGLMKLGDEITEINGKLVASLSLTKVYNLIQESDCIRLRIKPSQVHAV